MLIQGRATSNLQTIYECNLSIHVALLDFYKFIIAMRYRLALDLGTNSIGWALVELDAQEPPQPFRLIRLGSRIFSDGRNPKDGSSLAVERRGPRQMRRRRDRYLKRRDRFMQALIDCGLMPKDEAERKALVTENPYLLRQRGLDHALSLAEFGRALFHLNQRRGFKSNRKTDRSAGKESGKIKEAIAAFREAMGDARTVGEALARRHLDGKSVRARLVGKGKEEHYELYIDRDWIAKEFDALWESQRRFHSSQLTETAQERIKGILLHQRPLRPVLPGKCFLEPDERRAPAALPSAQLFRLYQEVNHLRIETLVDRKERPLKRNERDELLRALATKAEVKFEGLRKQLFGANREAFRFTLESENRKALKGCDTTYKLAHKQAFGARWHDFSLMEQNEIVSLLLNSENEAQLHQALCQGYQLSGEQADYIASRPLEDGFFRFSRKAIDKLLPPLRDAWNVENDAPLTYDKAVLAAGYAAHTVQAPDVLRPILPYYGEILWRYTQDAPTAKNPEERQWGKIANPTVHIGLNQVRKLINALIEKYGPPTQIAVELARELKAGLEEKQRIKQKQRENKERNDRIRLRLEELGQRDNAENRLRLKLFEELEKPGSQCIYTGRLISLARVFSNDYQIDHILPFSRTLDDGFSNKLLVHRDANKYKGDRTPFEAFGGDLDGYRWADIETRANRLPKEKRRRFEPDALASWLRNEKDFLARQLTDTAYLARCAKQYLAAVCPNHQVYVSPGRLTGMLRGKWGLDRILAPHDENGELRSLKNRNDHRHHAVDAAVIAVTDRSLLQRVATLAGRSEAEGLDRLLANMEWPWADYRHEIEQAIRRCVVSHKPDHGPEAALHNDTAYGISDGPRSDGKHIVHHRVEFASLKPGDESRIDCEGPLYVDLCAALSESDAKIRESRLQALAERYKQRKVRYLEPMSVVPIRPRDKYGKTMADAPPYKAYKGDSNYCYELFVNERGRWDGEVITTFQANQKAFRKFMADIRRYRTLTFGGKALLMRLCVNDVLAIEENEVRKIMRVAQLSEGKVVLAEHLEGGALRDRDRATADNFKYMTKSPGVLRELKARRVFVTITGEVRDPGFKA